jgi:hypothetical protein
VGALKGCANTWIPQGTTEDDDQIQPLAPGESSSHREFLIVRGESLHDFTWKIVDILFPIVSGLYPSLGKPDLQSHKQPFGFS